LNYRREKATLSKTNTMGNKVEPHKAIKKDLAIVIQDKTKTQTNHNHDIKYFRCLSNGYIVL
jgi:hypothetical protein